ncbi:MAG: hypothetical protein C0418_05930, partial [Coriobacteriaceae bacterium]|nr:hypothetical protein [Coriobacteriaceae bacterium]
RGVTFAKQFPNPAEPYRGLFVAEQVAATSRAVEWRVIAPVPWVPRVLADRLGKAYVKGDEERGGVPVAHPRYPVLPRRMLYSSVAPAMARAARPAFERARSAHQPQFVHAHALYPSAAAALRLAGPARLPLVVSVHGSDLYSNLARPAWREELERVVDRAAAIVCVSASLARDVVEALGADPAKVLVVPDTYDAETFRITERPARERRGTRLVAVGRLVDVKAHDVLLSAFTRLVREGHELKLTIVGEGPLRAELEQRAMGTGVDRRVTFAGALSGEELARTLAEAHLFVLPSRREGFGVALIEAMATGLPAVATRSGGPEDIVGEGDGVLVEPDDPAALAAGIAAVLARLERYDGAAIAQRVLMRFGPEVVGTRLVQVYREVLAHRGLTGTLAEAGE